MVTTSKALVPSSVAPVTSKARVPRDALVPSSVLLPPRARALREKVLGDSFASNNTCLTS